jgi:hypothetical protein
MPTPPTAHLGWNPNSEPDIDHYLLSVGSSSGNYNAPGSPKNMVNVTDGFFTLPGFGTFFFVLQAVNTSNQPSGPSSEVSGNFPAPTPPGPGRFLSG